MNDQLRINALAAEDMDDIWTYIGRDDTAAADGFLLRLWAVFELLTNNPGMGRKREELRKGLRAIPEGAYVIYYRAIPGGVEILRVLHGARDQRKALKKKLP